jgi:hypothetical protein
MSTTDATYLLEMAFMEISGVFQNTTQRSPRTGS